MFSARERRPRSRRIFISYRRRDTQSAVRSLSKELCAEFGRKQIFWDIDGIAGGAPFPDVLRRELESCGIMLAVIGDDWLEARDARGRRRLDDPGDLVRLEVATGLRNPNVVVIPVLVESAMLPDARSLPEDLQELPHRQYVEVRDARWDDDVRNLLRQVSSHRGDVISHRWTRRLSLAAGSAAAVALLVMGWPILDTIRIRDAGGPSVSPSGPSQPGPEIGTGGSSASGAEAGSADDGAANSPPSIAPGPDRKTPSGRQTGRGGRPASGATAGSGSGEAPTVPPPRPDQQAEDAIGQRKAEEERQKQQQAAEQARLAEEQRRAREQAQQRHDDIVALLDRFRQAYVSGNDAVLQETYPGVRSDVLIARTRRNCSAVALSFSEPQITLKGENNAFVDVQARYGCDPRTAEGMRYEDPLTDTFEVERTPGGWVIKRRLASVDG